MSPPVRISTLWALFVGFVGLLSLLVHGAEVGTAENRGEDSAALELATKLASRAIFLEVRVSPDGAHTAFIYYRNLPRTDAMEFTLAVTDNSGSDGVKKVAHYVLPSLRAMSDQDSTRATAAGFRWSPDGRSLAYLLPTDAGVDLMRWDMRSGASKPIERGHRMLELLERKNLEELVFLTQDEAAELADHVSERGLRIKDGYRFFGTLPNPNAAQRLTQQAWRFDWSAQFSRKIGDIRVVRELNEPPDVNPVRISQIVPSGTMSDSATDYESPDGATVIRRQYDVSRAESPYTARLARAFYFRKAGSKEVQKRLTTEADDMCRMDHAGWSKNSSQFVILEHCETDTAIIAVNREGSLRTVLRAPARLEVRQDNSEDNPTTGVSPDGRFVVLVRSSAFRAEDLVCLDLVDGTLRILASPNGEQPVMPPVKTSVLKLTDDIFKARLYLPDHTPGTKLPLVIATYYSGPGLEVLTGDELPILPLVKSGVAVMTFDAQDMIDGFGNGDPKWEIARVERPRMVLEESIAQAVNVYDVDPARVGIAGLSYGTEIATYGYWKSDKFKAVSSSGAGGPAPSWLMLGGSGYRTKLASRGLGDELAPVWKALSVTQNVRPNLPPLLLQTPDSERLGSVEAWYRLRAVGAQVEWWEYSNETHEKLGAADRWLTQQRNYDWFRFWLQSYEDPALEKTEQYLRWRNMRDAVAAAH